MHFKHCAAPLFTLGFEDTTLRPASNPFSYDAFTFNASNKNAVANPITSIEIVTLMPDTQVFPAIASGNQALESTFNQDRDKGASLMSLDISGNATFGPFVAVSGYINSFKSIGAGLGISIIGSFNGVNQPSCQSEIDTPGTLVSPKEVTFAVGSFGYCLLAFHLMTSWFARQTRQACKLKARCH